MCDCGTCCNACGHDQGCSVFKPLPDLDAVLADPRPGSFLGWLLQGGNERGAA